MIWPGENGEVILENRSDAHCVKLGARRLGDSALVAAVKSAQRQTKSGRLGEMVLAPELKEAVIESQIAIANMPDKSALLHNIFPEMGVIHVKHLQGPPSIRDEWRDIT